ncbi:MAG: carbamoyl-phosphate synthase large subunit [Limnochordaceae bacterium]|nr:carbamoyl-phosphate synthase large subunit [Limnochordaceae bacterium]
MPKDPSLHRVMLIGSGPIVIGQAAEFDYAGTQACRSLREEGLEVILVNSNPATIMTDLEMADRVYLEPLTSEYVAKILEKERPDGLLPTLGGQTGLNLAFELAQSGVLDRLGIRLLGTPLDAIERAEDRERFKETMLSIGEPVPESHTAESLEECVRFAEQIGYPVIVRPAYTLGGAGGGIAANRAQLEEICVRGLRQSLIHQVLLEKSVAGWKEIEYEVMRDHADNCITICNMENLDPIGIHTGDSIVVAPSQTLSDREYQMLRSASLKIIRALGIEGGCNIQFALDPHSFRYYVIEVNPRVSRSSALASKATGYPIARVAAKIAVGLTLPEIRNAVTGETTACFEPALDYVVVKFPRWPFDKFAGANRVLGTQMKATGEVMAIDRSFEGALLKAVRSLEIDLDGLEWPGVAAMSDETIRNRLQQAEDDRLFVLAEAVRRGWSTQEIYALSKVDPWFIEKVRGIVELEKRWQAAAGTWLKSRAAITAGSCPAHVPALLAQAKRWGMADSRLATLWGVEEGKVRALRQALGLRPVYKVVDTCAGEFAASTPYFYSTYEQEDEATVTPRRKVLVLGSGPIRIGQGIEFDYCSVRSVWALRQAGVEAIIINNNPETVSTDFDTADRLYFEPLALEDVLEVVTKEKPEGVVVQFGGQTAINLCAPLAKAGVPILGTSPDSIDIAEDRERFSELATALGIRQTEGATATTMAEAMGIALKLGFPLVVRPSYVLGGRAMEIVHNETELLEYMKMAAQVSHQHPVLLDRYLEGTECEVDCIADGETVVIPGIMQHIERAGIHSGDSMAVFPPYSLTPAQMDTIVRYTERLARALQIKGLMNVQFVAFGDEVYVLEVNPRASRTVPFLSKVTGVPMVDLATRVMLGEKLADLGYRSGLLPPPPFITVKAPVFSFEKLGMVDTGLGPEMKSTGEVLSLADTWDEAVYKALLASAGKVPRQGTLLATLADRDKEEGIPLVAALAKAGFAVYATEGTARALAAAGVKAQVAAKIGEGHPTVLDLIYGGKVNLVLNTPTRGKIPWRSGFQLRRAAVELKIPCITALDTFRALVRVVTAAGVRDSVDGITRPEAGNTRDRAATLTPQVLSLGEYLQRRRLVEEVSAPPAQPWPAGKPG